MNAKTYIVLVNYNGWQDTIECIESVLLSDYDNYQIIIVDNASTDNSTIKIKEWANKNITTNISFSTYNAASISTLKEKQSREFDSRIILIESSNNGGFASGNNIAINLALHKNDFSYIWLLNNDTVIKKDTLSEIIRYSEKHQTGITGSTLKYYAEPNEIQSLGGVVNKYFGTVRSITKIDKNNKNIDYIIGASFLIKKSVIDKIGLLPEEYFLYYEETDYCFQATKNGFSIGTALNSIVFHKEGASTGCSKNPHERSAFSDILSLKNRIKFHQKYLGGGIFLWLGIAIALFNRIKRGQFKRIIQFLREMNEN